MADKRFDNLNEEEIQELMRLLEQMQSRPRVEEVEEVLIDSGHPDLVRMDIYSPPVVGEGYDPTAASGNLADMLITPEEVEEVEQQQAKDHRAFLMLAEEPEEEDEELPPPPADRRNPFAVLWQMTAATFPRRGDSGSMRLIKGGILLSTVAVLAAIAVLLVQMVVLPVHNRQYNDKLAAWFDPDNTAVVSDTDQYPEGMLASFKKLYRTNNDVKGFLSFHATGEDDFLDMDYPVVQTDDNTTYKTADFHKRFNRNGTLFFDAKCRISNGDTNRSLILYGNALGNGQMLSGLNHLVSNEAYARQAYQLTLSTLYEQSDYYVFAVLLLDKDETLAQRTIPLQNRFITTDTFFDYVQQLRDRSLFDYPTDIVDTDSILLLVTDLGKMNGALSNGQVVVAARRVRPGEQPYDAEKIGPNDDVLMPYRWYGNQGLTPPDFYRGKDEVDTTTTTLTTNDPFATESTGDTVTSSTEETTTTTTTTTTAATTTTTTTMTTTTTTAETEPSETEPSETEPTETEPSEGTETEPSEIQE